MGNLLTDPEATFETGLSADWVNTGGPVTRSSGGGHTGTYFMNIAAASALSSPVNATLQRDIPITAGTPYLVEGWGRPQAGQVQPCIVVFSFANPGGFSGGPFIDFVLVRIPGSGATSIGTWGHITDTVTLSSGANYAWIRVLNHPSASAAAGDNCDFDDMFFGTPDNKWRVGVIGMN